LVAANGAGFVRAGYESEQGYAKFSMRTTGGIDARIQVSGAPGWGEAPLGMNIRAFIVLSLVKLNK